MMIHRLIDVLNAPRTKNFLCPPSVKTSIIVDLLRLSEKFDFGALHLELNSRGEAQIPVLTEEEDRFFEEGYIPFPASSCWYEFTLPEYFGERKVGLLFTDRGKDGDERWFTRFEFNRNTGHGMYLGAIGRISRSDPYYLMVDIPKDVDEIAPHELIESLKECANADWLMIRYLTLMINSRSSHTKRVDGATPLTATAAHTFMPGRKEPKYAHTVVTIITKEHIAAARAEGVRTHASPRLHWRRSHLRVYADGHKVVIPRHIVGRAEDGVVSHEYKVR